MSTKPEFKPIEAPSAEPATDLLNLAFQRLDNAFGSATNVASSLDAARKKKVEEIQRANAETLKQQLVSQFANDPEGLKRAVTSGEFLNSVRSAVGDTGVDKVFGKYLEQVSPAAAAQTADALRVEADNRARFEARDDFANLAQLVNAGRFDEIKKLDPTLFGPDGAKKLNEAYIAALNVAQQTNAYNKTLDEQRRQELLRDTTRAAIERAGGVAGTFAELSKQFEQEGRKRGFTLAQLQGLAPITESQRQQKEEFDQWIQEQLGSSNVTAARRKFMDELPADLTPAERELALRAFDTELQNRVRPSPFDEARMQKANEALKQAYSDNPWVQAADDPNQTGIKAANDFFNEGNNKEILRNLEPGSLGDKLGLGPISNLAQGIKDLIAFGVPITLSDGRTVPVKLPKDLVQLFVNSVPDLKGYVVGNDAGSLLDKFLESEENKKLYDQFIEYSKRRADLASANQDAYSKVQGFLGASIVPDPKPIPPKKENTKKSESRNTNTFIPIDPIEERGRAATRAISDLFK